VQAEELELLASAKAIAHHGATVVINYIKSKDKAEELLDEIKKAGGNGLVFQADVRDKGAVNKMVESTLKEFGKIDVLVNNANINFPIRPFIELTWDQIEAKILGEMRALYNCSQAVLKDMLNRKSGKLIFVSSSLSRFPGYGFSAHAAAKSAMDSMAKVMAMELGPSGITVNVVGPGLTLTDATAGQPKEVHEQVAAITPLRRLGMPDDIAGVVLFLASSLSDYLNGEYIPVTGGSFMI
jgi:3-oxoacyl-[acyl-carrier protein] reductase